MMWKGVFGCLCVLIVAQCVSASLGISPAKQEFLFEPGKEIVVAFSVFSDDPERGIALKVGGDLSDYVTLSTYELVGGGSFSATIRLPETATPGPHRIGISAREKPPENVFIGTVVDISGVIDIFVPYPGRYAEGRLIISNANVGDDIPVEMSVTNRGVEPLTVAPVISFYSSTQDNSRNSLVHTMTFTPVLIVPGATQYYRKILSTDTSLPGEYFAESVVDYGQKLVVNQSFRIGSAFVRYLNHTPLLPQAGLQKFNISVASEWNDDFEAVYADITLSQGGTALTSFRTPPIALLAWQRGYLEAYIDTEALPIGMYDVAFTLHYGEALATYTGTLEIYQLPFPVSFIAGIVLGIVGLLVVIILIRRHNHSRHKRYKARIHTKYRR